MTSSRLLVFMLAVAPAAMATTATTGMRANPIRKVVTMLQDMQKKVTAEGKKEEELYEKFMCYCKNNVGTLEASIQASKDKIEQLTADNEADVERKKTTEANLKEHKTSLADAKDAMEKATELRKKEETAFNKFKSDSETNIDAIGAAVSAIEKGMGAFLQTKMANVVRRYTMEKAEISDDARQELLAFLAGSNSQGYAPASGEIVGILKQMQDTMIKELKDAKAAENEAAQTYRSLMKTKKKESATLQAQIEKEIKMVGDLSIKLAEIENELEETEDSLAADEKFLSELEKGCKTKTAEWEAICKTRSEELLALADTIKILNDDDALELFKKTLPAPSASFIQMDERFSSMRRRALDTIKAARARSHKKGMPARPQFDFIELALNGKTLGYEKILKMIDQMVAQLKKEQEDDDTKKEYCESKLDEFEDKKKVLDNNIEDSNTAIEEMEGEIATLKSELAALEDGIKKLDKAVSDATAQRKAEHADFEDLIASDTAAKEILLFAKNRLNKFYNPKLYKPPPKKELSSEDRISENFSGAAAFVQVSMREEDDKAAPPPPPETFGAYSKKSEESGGVIAMIDLLVADLEKEMQTSKVDEKNAQEEYETLIADSAAKREADSKAIVEKEGAKAQNEEQLEAEKENKADLSKDHMGVVKELYNLHGECDWLLKFFEVRKEARTGEIDALGKAKAVLSGADYSLIQEHSFRKLRR